MFISLRNELSVSSCIGDFKSLQKIISEEKNLRLFIYYLVEKNRFILNLHNDSI